MLVPMTFDMYNWSKYNLKNLFWIFSAG